MYQTFLRTKIGKNISNDDGTVRNVHGALDAVVNKDSSTAVGLQLRTNRLKEAEPVGRPNSFCTTTAMERFKAARQPVALGSRNPVDSATRRHWELEHGLIKYGERGALLLACFALLLSPACRGCRLATAARSCLVTVLPLLPVHFGSCSSALACRYGNELDVNMGSTKSPWPPNVPYVERPAPKPKEEHFAYTTTSNLYGAKAHQREKEVESARLGNKFTNSFNGFRFVDGGLQAKRDAGWQMQVDTTRHITPTEG